MMLKYGYNIDPVVTAHGVSRGKGYFVRHKSGTGVKFIGHFNTRKGAEKFVRDADQEN